MFKVNIPKDSQRVFINSNTKKAVPVFYTPKVLKMSSYFIDPDWDSEKQPNGRIPANSRYNAFTLI